MKKLSTYLFLILFSFSAPSFADDISDFEIEGMSIGDSLLDYFSKSKIESGYKNYYDSNKYIGVELRLNNYEKYKIIQVHYKPDGKYLVSSIVGGIFFDNKKLCRQL